MDPLLNDAPCGFFSFSDDGLILQVNASLLKMLGRESCQMVGERLDTILSAGARIFYQTHLFPLLKMYNRADEIYFSFSTAQGEVPVLINALRRERDGTMVTDCVVVPMRKRYQYETEIIEARKQAEAAIKAKEELIAVISHEMRTPLTTILTWARMLQSGKLDENAIRRANSTIERNARSQMRLIEDILDSSRITAGKFHLHKAPMEICKVVKTAVDDVRPVAEEKQVELQLHLDSHEIEIMGDAQRLEQVMLNLLANALKFTPAGGRVTVELKRFDAQMEICVRDTGKGISSEFLPHVFESLRQDEEGGANRQAGLGLGLAITRHIVEEHGGTIRVESEGKGMGAAFIFQLPCTLPEVSAERKTG
ncbi:MAG TPA: PAS domain-containing sensor histidine kinase [Planctomycetota bacterium]|nr:PAS domain-containing sensor histidine kinase [Planctomycetota bacterium]